VLSFVEAPHMFAEYFGGTVEAGRSLQRVIIDNVPVDIQTIGTNAAGEKHLPYPKKPRRLQNMESPQYVGAHGGCRVCLRWQGEHATQMVNHVRLGSFDSI